MLKVKLHHLLRPCAMFCALGLPVLTASAVTIAELQAENELLQVRSKVNFLSLCVIICVIMIFFMWGMKERHRKHVMLLERKNQALQRNNKLVEEAKDFAEHESQMKTIYTKNLSHEIRTPLSQMYGFVQLLANDDVPLDNEQRKEVVNALVEGCEQLKRVVENIDIVSAKLDKMETLSEVESVLKV
ncbi:MAG: histidine kinase dimerization/phospho-acceptor domain-containing protein [Prevotellaceae bacterium]|nr:histidine kinase dimerization/phospho-acceptor domain-containing protein [Prevotellaceae bacterium]